MLQWIDFCNNYSTGKSKKLQFLLRNDGLNKYENNFKSLQTNWCFYKITNGKVTLKFSYCKRACQHLWMIGEARLPWKLDQKMINKLHLHSTLYRSSLRSTLQCFASFIHSHTHTQMATELQCTENERPTRLGGLISDNRKPRTVVVKLLHFKDEQLILLKARSLLENTALKTILNNCAVEELNWFQPWKLKLILNCWVHW